MSTPIRPPGLADHLILLRNRLLEHERLSTEAALKRVGVSNDGVPFDEIDVPPGLYHGDGLQTVDSKILPLSAAVPESSE